MANRLQNSSSPYLLQHKDNPVDWYPWGEEALQKAKTENKPLFVSIGYSSCHWCHVMEREAFSNEEIAAVLNEKFVPVKVDREERPDIDHLYMQAVQIMTGSGGWPLNVFLTPDLRPFYGGTYFPIEARYGRPPFKDILLHLDEAYHNRLADVRRSADQLTGMIVQMSLLTESKPQLSSDFWEKFIASLKGNFDSSNGGLGSAPKFFYVDGHRNLLKSNAEMVALTLEKISYGGIYDQVRGGFHRYSTDAQWKIPHFEKMLYDNALLIRLFSEAFRSNGNDLYRAIVEETIEWLRVEMVSSDGLFFSAIDADSDHEEGLYYTWTNEELQTLFSESEFMILQKFFEISSEGNFERRIHFVWKQTPSLHERGEAMKLLERLQSERLKKIRPLIDRKILTSWNGLMISGLSIAGEVFSNREWVSLAERAAQALWSSVREERNLWHSQCDGRLSKVSFLEDYAFLADGLLDLWEVSGAQQYKTWALELADDILRIFYDSQAGGFWSTSPQQTDLLARAKEVHDGAIPSPYQVACGVMSRAFTASGENRFLEAFSKSTQAVFGSMEQSPGAFNRLALVMADHEKRIASLGACSPDGVCEPASATFAK